MRQAGRQFCHLSRAAFFLFFLALVFLPHWADAAEYAVVKDGEQANEAIRPITIGGVQHTTLSGLVNGGIQSGDTVSVGPGVYTLGATLNLKAGVRLVGAGDDVTVLSGSENPNASVVAMKDAAATTANTVLKGFTLTKGIFSHGGFGGGMYIKDGSLEVANCTFTKNKAESGGGMYIEGSSPRVTGCIFADNTADEGGGIFNSKGSPEVTNCAFSSNKAGNNDPVSVPGGGGMYNFGDDSDPNRCRPILRNCTFSGNWAFQYGGGVNNISCKPMVINCTFKDNTASVPNNGGQAILNASGTEAVIVNSILMGTVIDYVSSGIPSSDSTLGHCVVSEAGLVSSDHNVTSADPRLKAVSRDIDGTLYTIAYELEAGSSALGTGNASAAPAVDQRGWKAAARNDIGSIQMNAEPTELTGRLLPSSVTVAAGQQAVFALKAWGNDWPLTPSVEACQMNGAPLPHQFENGRLSVMPMASGTLEVLLKYGAQNGTASASVTMSTLPEPSPDIPPITPPAPPAPSPQPPASVDVPLTADQWEIVWGVPDAQGSIPVTFETRIRATAPIDVNTVSVDTAGLIEVRSILLPDKAAASVSHVFAAGGSGYTYTLRVAGLASGGRDTVRIDAVRYRLEGDEAGKERTIPLGPDGKGILLKDMRPRQDGKSSGGCSTGFSLPGLLALSLPFLRRRR